MKTATAVNPYCLFHLSVFFFERGGKCQDVTHWIECNNLSVLNQRAESKFEVAIKLKNIWKS
jgi:hypothetical protein